MKTLLSRCGALGAVAAALAVVALPAPAGATFAGKPGRIAYQTFEGIYTVRPDGTGTRKVAPAGSHDPEWSRDGKSLLYQRRYFELWRSRADGSHARRILSGPDGDKQIHSVAWSPDGRRIAMELVWEVPVPGAEDGEVESRHGIYVVRRDGTGLRELHAGREPAWSPDGRWIAFAANRGVARIRPDGKRFGLLRRVEGYTSSIDFAPDGKRLLYFVNSGPATIHTLTVATRKDRALAPARVDWPMDAAWTPDGKRVAYLHQTVPASGVWPPTVLYTIRPDGTGKRRVLTFPERRWADALSWQAIR